MARTTVQKCSKFVSLNPHYNNWMNDSQFSNVVCGHAWLRAGSNICSFSQIDV